MSMSKEKAWNYALGIIKVDGLEPSPEFLELVEKEKRGEITTADIIKALNEKYKFQDIKLMASSVLSKMKAANWEKMTLDKKAETLSKYMAELWKVHAFREGNTRTVVTFCCQYAESKGFALDTELFAKIVPT